MDRWASIRDVILFFGGLTGVVSLTGAWLLYGIDVSEALLLFFGSMMGLPAFLRKDERSGT